MPPPRLLRFLLVTLVKPLRFSVDLLVVRFRSPCTTTTLLPAISVVVVVVVVVVEEPAADDVVVVVT